MNGKDQLRRPGPGETAEAPNWDATADEGTLAVKALSGVAWHWGGVAALVLAQVASTAATARLLAPEEFGLYAVAQAAAALAGQFTLAAVAQGILRRSSLGPKTIGTALVLSIASSGLVSVALFAAAPFWARAWGAPEAEDIVRVVAVGLFLTSAGAVPLALIRRTLRFRLAVSVETGAIVGGMAASVVLAVVVHSAWALALGQVVAGALLAGVGAILVRKELQLGFHRGDASELMRFASQVASLSFVTYFTSTAPSWFTGRMFGASALGLYSRASLVVALPAEYMLTSIVKVIYPFYGRVRDDATRVGTLITEALSLTTGLVWPFLALVAGAAPVLVPVLLGDQWGGAVELLPLFALIACGWVPCGLLTNAAEALGWMRVIAWRQLVFFAGIAVTLGTAYAGDLGLVSVLTGVAVTEVITYILTLRAFTRRDVLHGPTVTREQAIHLVVALACFGAAAGCAEGLQDMTLPVQVGGQIAVGVGTVAAMLAGARWIPAAQVLDRRLDPGSSRGLLAKGWAALR